MIIPITDHGSAVDNLTYVAFGVFTSDTSVGLDYTALAKPVIDIGSGNDGESSFYPSIDTLKFPVTGPSPLEIIVGS